MKKVFTCTLLLLLLALCASHSFSQSQRNGMTPAETLRVQTVSDAQISPDGEWVVYSVSKVEGKETATTLWLARTGGLMQRATDRRTPLANLGAVSPLIASTLKPSNPRWSPDSRRIAFYSTQNNQKAIYVISLADRTPRLIASIHDTNFHIAYAGESFAWSPDARRIAFISATEDEGDANEIAGATSERTHDDPRVVSRIQYKSRTSFSDQLRTHVFVGELDSSGSVAGTRQLTTGRYYDHAITWNPQSNEIAFLSNHEEDPDANNNTDIYAVNMDGRVRQITNTQGCEYEPQWSPDGKWIAYVATKRDVTTIDSIAEDAHVWVISADGGTGRELTAQQDRRARSPRWSPDNRSIFFLASDRGETLLYRVGTDGGSVQRVIESTQRAETTSDPRERRPQPLFYDLGRFQITNFSVVAKSSAEPAFALTVSNATSPAEVWLASANGERFLRLSAHNDALMRPFALSQPEEFTFKSFDGTNIQGWLMKPLGFREDRRYPLILSIHGGPHGMYGYSFNAAFQVYAARGYAVLFLNPRGSNGYGQKFSEGTLREWGGGDYRDLMAGMDEALRRYSWIDADRLGVTGGSYGGFMTNWIITQTTRFRAAVSQASVSNLISFYSTSVYQDLIHAEFGGFPWDDYDLLWRWSPLRYVKQAQTPTLFIHGEQDNDVHITEAEQMYMALRRRGIETVLVRYPREGHGLREPRHRQDALERTLAWFDKYLK